MPPPPKYVKHSQSTGLLKIEPPLTFRSESSPNGTLVFVCALADPSAIHASPADVERFLSHDAPVPVPNRVWTQAA